MRRLGNMAFILAVLIMGAVGGRVGARGRPQQAEKVYIPLIYRTGPTLPAGLPVLSSKIYRESAGVQRIVGEVQNTTDQYAQIDRILASFHDASGGVINTFPEYAKLTTIAPGQRAPFAIFAQIDSTVSISYTLDLQWNPTLNPPARGVTIVSIADAPHSSGVPSYRRLFGEVRNATGAPIRGIEILVSAYDVSGNIVDVVLTGTTVFDLAPGQTTQFEGTAIHWFGVQSYVAQVQDSRSSAPGR